jgi:hypothetical protein
VLKVYWQEERSGKVKDLNNIAAWVRKNTNGSDLIAASEFIYGGVYLDRPVVALPFYKTLNQENLASFINTYKPRAVILEKNDIYRNALVLLGYRQDDKSFPGSHFMILRP